MFLTITIDTEEDNWGEYRRSSYSVENVKRIPRLQAIFDERGVRPTYLITAPVVGNDDAVRILGDIRERGGCEIGTHLHPWNTAPMVEERTRLNSYASNLHRDLQYLKLKTLHDSIAARFGVAPTAHRSGRWGFSDDVARSLIRLGYAVDTSLLPASDWTQEGGPDFSRCTSEPFVYRLERAEGRSADALLEVPATVDFLRWPRMARGAYWSIKRALPAADKLLAGLAKVGAINHISVSPELNTSGQMIRLAAALLDRGSRVINMFFHSPSLLAGCSPFVRNETEADAFLDRIDKFLAFARGAALESVTMSQLTKDALNVSKTRVLRAVGAGITRRAAS